MRTKTSTGSQFGRPQARRGAPRVSERGVMLTECLVYLAVVLVVVSAGLAVFYQVLEYSIRLRRNADDIVRVLRAGEQWRADVRSASGPLVLERGRAGFALQIPQPNGQIAYVFLTNVVVRCTEADDRCRTILAGVKCSSFHQDPRGSFNSWRWELELASPMKAVRVRPQFTFSAVPRKEVKP